jgi:bifunctional non-homologous end joining protein LigD
VLRVRKQNRGLAEDQDHQAAGSPRRRFTAPRRTRPFFGALVLAVREDDIRRYIGHVGTGFSHRTLEELHAKLVKLKIPKSPFPGNVKDERVTTWVNPSLVAEVKFAE